MIYYERKILFINWKKYVLRDKRTDPVSAAAQIAKEDQTSSSNAELQSRAASCLRGGLEVPR
jgi:hypothetical protein